MLSGWTTADREVRQVGSLSEFGDGDSPRSGVSRQFVVDKDILDKGMVIDSWEKTRKVVEVAGEAPKFASFVA
jgi:hypothetical protein